MFRSIFSNIWPLESKQKRSSKSATFWGIDSRWDAEKGLVKDQKIIRQNRDFWLSNSRETKMSDQPAEISGKIQDILAYEV